MNHFAYFPHIFVLIYSIITIKDEGGYGDISLSSNNIKLRC